MVSTWHVYLSLYYPAIIYLIQCMHISSMHSQVAIGQLQSDLHNGGQSHSSVSEWKYYTQHAITGPVEGTITSLWVCWYVCTWHTKGTCRWNAHGMKENTQRQWLYVWYVTLCIPHSLHERQLHIWVVLRPLQCVHHHWHSVGQSMYIVLQ